jgi:sec-independent protein translocase protein TatA
MNIGSPELLIILVVVILLFGAGRISKVGGELGTAIREFRRGLNGEPNNEKTDTQSASHEKST